MQEVDNFKIIFAKDVLYREPVIYYLLLPYDIYNNVTKPHPLLNAKKNSTIYLLDSPIVT